ncbi:hypothetical protein Tco_0523894 [Tanacetum coccineum]
MSGGITRLKQHLTHTKGDVAGCSKVKTDITKRVLASMHEKEKITKEKKEKYRNSKEVDINKKTENQAKMTKEHGMEKMCKSGQVENVKLCNKKERRSELTEEQAVKSAIGRFPTICDDDDNDITLQLTPVLLKSEAPLTLLLWRMRFLDTFRKGIDSFSSQRCRDARIVEDSQFCHSSKSFTSSASIGGNPIS